MHADEPFLLLAELKCTSPWQLDIQNSEIALVSFCYEFEIVHMNYLFVSLNDFV